MLCYLGYLPTKQRADFSLSTGEISLLLQIENFCHHKKGGTCITVFTHERTLKCSKNGKEKTNKFIGSPNFTKQYINTLCGLLNPFHNMGSQSRPWMLAFNDVFWLRTPTFFPEKKKKKAPFLSFSLSLFFHSSLFL